MTTFDPRLPIRPIIEPAPFVPEAWDAEDFAHVEDDVEE